MKKNLFFLFLAVIQFTFCINAFSQLIIDKGKIKLEVTPGDTIIDYISVHNSSSGQIGGRVYFQDFVYLPPFDGRKQFLPLGSTEYSCGPWIKFSPQEFSLSPFGKEKVSYTMTVPEEAKGGYYGTLFFEAAPGIIEDEGVALKVVQRIGCLFFLETYDKDKKAEVKNLSFKTQSIRGDFLNSGNSIILPSGVFYIVDEEGIVADRGEIAKFYLPPSETVDFEISLPGTISSGDYTAVITFDLEDGDVLIKEVDFEKDALGNIKILRTRD